MERTSIHLGWRERSSVCICGGRGGLLSGMDGEDLCSAISGVEGEDFCTYKVDEGDFYYIWGG